MFVFLRKPVSEEECHVSCSIPCSGHWEDSPCTKCNNGTYVETYVITDFGVNSHCHNNTVTVSSCSLLTEQCPWEFIYNNFTGNSHQK